MPQIGIFFLEFFLKCLLSVFISDKCDVWCSQDKKQGWYKDPSSTREIRLGNLCKVCKQWEWWEPSTWTRKLESMETLHMPNSGWMLGQWDSNYHNKLRSPQIRCRIYPLLIFFSFRFVLWLDFFKVSTNWTPSLFELWISDPIYGAKGIGNAKR